MIQWRDMEETGVFGLRSRVGLILMLHALLFLGVSKLFIKTPNKAVLNIVLIFVVIFVLIENILLSIYVRNEVFSLKSIALILFFTATIFALGWKSLPYWEEDDEEDE